MVVTRAVAGLTAFRVSVLALSSRFDGLIIIVRNNCYPQCFSTRSVESF